MGVATGLVVFALAALVYVTRPERPQNRRLALLLTAEAVVAVTGTGLMFLSARVEEAYAWQAPTVMALVAMPFLYLRFVATLDTPLVRHLRLPVVDAALVALAVVAPLAWFVMPQHFVAGMYVPWFAPWELLPGAGWLQVAQLNAAACLFGVVAAISTLRRAAPGVGRARARAFAVAFVTRDGFWATAMVAPIFLPGLSPDTTFGGLFWASGPPVAQLLYVPLLAYGILKAQLFDIDLKIKVALRQSTIAAVFAGAFFVASEGIEAALDVSGTLPGILAAAAVAVALRPIQRFAERVANGLMPHTQATPDYLDARKRDVYRAALEGALQDGAVSERERDILARLQRELALGDEDVDALRREVAAAPARGDAPTT